MGLKHLTSTEKELVIGTAIEILKTDGITKLNVLDEKVRKKLPQLRGKSLRAGINWGLKEKKYFRIKFKGLSLNKPIKYEKDYYSSVEEHWKSQGCLTQPQKGRLGIPDISAVR
jgi:hypothetical protein